MKSGIKKALLLGLGVFCAGNGASAADLLWTGKYRAEGNFIKNYTLSSASGIEDSYIIHHLTMSPKIIALDGLNINARFDAFNGSLPNSQHGQVFGNYPSNTSGTATTQTPAVLSRSQAADTFVVNELYLNWINEFGAFVAGRVPFEFGLGMTYNNGQGNFDHYLSNKDLVGYKLVLGNISVFPAYGKVREGVLTNEDDINDYLAVIEYNNPETDLSLGFMYDNRVAPFDSSTPNQGNDIPTSYFSASPGLQTPNANFSAITPLSGGYSVYNMNFYGKKKWENFNLGIELGFVNGSTGLKVTDASNPSAVNYADLNGFGGAAEIGYRSGRVKLNLRLGYASGDDPDTVRIESYAFSPNYHVAMLMFRYPMGQFDVLRSSIYGTHPATGAAANSATSGLGGLDTETITNAYYFAPNLVWTLGDRYDLNITACYANEVKPPVSTANYQTSGSGLGSMGTSLGFETDFGLTYHLNNAFTWETTFGLFFPGSAWAGPSNAGYSTSMAYGATSKAAINF